MADPIEFPVEHAENMEMLARHTAPNGWPDPERPGVPMNPEQDGYHWMDAVDRGVPTGHTAVMFWFAGAGFYAIEAVPVSHRNITEHWHYIGPCPTPAKVAARVAEMEARKDAAYEERNRVVALLAAVFPSVRARTAISQKDMSND